MSRILAVFGVTLRNLFQKYKISAITCDVNSEKAKQLKEKVEVVQGDVLNQASLETALTSTHTIFAMTTPSFGPDDLEVEYNSGKTIADVAVEKGVEYIIFSTVASKFVGAILAECKGKACCAVAAIYSLEEVAAIPSKATGKTVVYKQIPLEDFKKSLPLEEYLEAHPLQLA